MLKVTFTDTSKVSENYAPKPASQYIPDWYKNMDSYVNGEKKPTGDGTTTATIKRCMPVFDSITQGYIITTYTDIYVSKKSIVDENGQLKSVPWYEWASNSALDFHPVEQAETHPKSNGFPYPKLVNPWAIKTPKGYSTLFIAPVHRNNEFTILPGVVDTDTYIAPVNFPMVLTNPDFEGVVPAGTPIAQIIPFKRDRWKMGLGGELEIKETEKLISNIKRKFFDGYKLLFRQEKEYK
jgi:hypothetical protein